MHAGVGDGVAPHARTGDAQRPQGIFAGGDAAGLEAALARVSVADAQGAGVGEVGRAGVFRHRANGVACDHRGVVGAVDADSEGLVDEGALVINDASGVGLGDALAFLERLGGGQGVVQRVGPHARARIEGNRAVGAAGRALQAPGPGGASIHVAGREGAAGRGRTGHRHPSIRAAGFHNVAAQGRWQVGHNWHVVDPCDGHIHGLGGTVNGLDREGLCLGLAGFEVLHRGVGDGVAPHARTADVQTAQRTCAGRDASGLEAALACVNVADGQRAGGSEVVGR